LESLSFLEADMHAHWLPGLDDGAPDLAHSLDLLQRLADLGYRRLWATPHVMADLYPNRSEVILEKLVLVRTAAKEAGLDLQLETAAEYLLDEGFGEKIAAGDLLTLPGNQVLVEMSFVSPPPQLDTYIFQLQTKGYRVIIAHPERYMFYHQDQAVYHRLREKGCALQLNLLSLTGYYGKAVREVGLRLLKEGLVDYLGTDMHHRRHAAELALLLTDRSLNKLLHKYREQLRNAALV
jgi:protein-tyrosine phosphatase